MPAVGVAKTTLNLGEFGYGLTVGTLDNLNTFGLNVGRNIYVAPGGGYTQTSPPAPSLSQPIGVIGEASATQGRLFINGPVAPVGSGNAQTASIALTASYVSSSNVDGPLGMDSVLSSSYAVSASHLIGLRDSVRLDFTAATNVNFFHGLDTENVIIQVYQDDASTGNLPVMINPDTVTLNNINNATVTFAAPTTGYVVATRGGFLKSGSIEFSYSSSVAVTASNAQTASFALKTNTVTLPIFNDDAVVIPKGYPVYIEEHDGTRYRVRIADAASASRMPAFAVASEDLAVGGTGDGIVVGDINGLNTFGLDIGRNLYVASGGGWTQTPPTGTNQTQPFGVVGEESPITGRFVINGPVADVSVGSGDDTLVPAIRQDFVNVVTVTVNHGLNSETVIVQAYQDDAATGNLPVLINPDTVTLTDPDTAVVTFAAPTTGYIVVSQGGYLRSGSVEFAATASYIDNTFKQNVAGGLTYAIVHNLNEEFPIVQAYDIVTRAQEIPASIVSAGPQSVTVTFAVIFNGTIIVKK